MSFSPDVGERFFRIRERLLAVGNPDTMVMAVFPEAAPWAGLAQPGETTISQPTTIATMSQLFYAGPNRQPIQASEAELSSLLRGGTLNGKSLVWQEGWPNWRPLEEAFPQMLQPPPAPALATPTMQQASYPNTPSTPAVTPGFAAPTPTSPAPSFNAPLTPSVTAGPTAVAMSAALGSPGMAAPAMAAAAVAGLRRCHEVDYEILGHDMQIVEIELDPGETVIAEAGAMNYMEAEIQFETKMGDGSNPNPTMWDRLKQVGKRMFTGESLFMTHFTNRGATKRRVAFAAPYPGKVLALDLAKMGGTLLCQKDAFLCAAFGTAVGIAFTQKIGTGLFGGEGFILQKLDGDGLAFIHAGGMVVKKELRGETILVDTGCLVAFTTGIDYSIQRAGNLKSMVFGGEGLFLATLRGHGTVWLQSLPLSKLSDRILANAAGGKRDDSGSLLGGLGNLFES